MEKYKVLLTNKAIYDIDNIYDYIANDLSVSSTAIGIVNNIEEAILSLEYLPTRGSIRKVGNFAGKNYRQLFVGSYIIVYKVEEVNRQVIILTVQNARQNF